MPSKRPHTCNMRGCPKLTTTYYCVDHGESKQDDRPSASQRGYNTRWRKESKAFILKHPFCAQCERENRITLGNQVDHIKPHKGDITLFWDRNNWQNLCQSCHSKKTASEDMGYWNSSNGLH